MSRPRSIRRLGGSAIALFLVLALLVGVWIRADRRADRAADAQGAVTRVVDDRTVAGLVQDERAIVAEGANAAAAEQITDLAVARANLPAVGVSLASARDVVATDTDAAIAQYNEIINSLLARSTDADIGLDLGSAEALQLLRAGGAYSPLREALATEAATAASGSNAELAAAFVSTNDWVETAQARTPAVYGSELQQIVGADALDELRSLGAAATDGDSGAAAELALAVDQKMDALSVLQRSMHDQLQSMVAAEVAAQERAKLRNPSAVLGTLLIVGALGGALAYRVLRPARYLADDAEPILAGDFAALVDEVERGVQVAPTVAPLRTESATLAPVADALNLTQRAALDQAAGRADSRNQLLDTVATAGLKAERMLAEQRSLLADFEKRTTELDDVLFLDRMRGVLTGLARTNDHLLVLSEADGLPVPIVGASPMTAILAAGQQSSRTPRRVQLAVGQDAAVPNELARDLTKVVRDLLDNALAFSPPHTTVTLQGDAADGIYVVWITDEGIGLDPDVCAELNFELAHPRPVDELGASGVGIAVVSRLAERHGLDVQLVTEESTGVQARVSIPAELLISVSDSLEIDVSPEELLADRAAAERPDSDKPDSEKPDSEEPDSEEPDSEEPDFEKPVAERPESDWPDAGKAGAEPADNGATPADADLTDELLAEAGSGLANLANRARMAEAAASAFDSPSVDPAPVEAADTEPVLFQPADSDGEDSIDLAELVSSHHDTSTDDVFWADDEPKRESAPVLDIDLFEDLEYDRAPSRPSARSAPEPPARPNPDPVLDPVIDPDAADPVPVPTVLGADGEPEHCVELPLSARIAAAEARPSLATLADRLRK
ncbi:MAG: hypothetical protein HKN26_02295 [Acidimicrobiales bacterium]|nr:hypothetical protein [Acidimicrobiales bacterium]